jgi:hypothetical protein
MRARLAFLVLSCVSYGLVQACGGEATTGIDASTDGSVGNDAPINGNDASNDVAQQMDTSPMDDTGTTSDASDGGAPDTAGMGINSWTCGNTTVSDCSLCIGHTQTCVYCADNDASALSGVCVQFGTGCGNTIPMGSNLCACDKDAGGCPEPYQVCLQITQTAGVCDTCGAVTTTNGLTCENGGKCDAVDGGCL